MPEFTEQEFADRVEAANQYARAAFEMLPFDHPVGCVQWIQIDRVQANDWNPNSVAHLEMKLLHTSIDSDGFTQPVVAIWDPDCRPEGEAGSELGRGRYVIVDGFHRYTTMRMYPDIYAKSGGYLPVVVLHKSVADRIASTVRHNRARGKHSVKGMSSLVFQMLTEGESDESICDKIGLEPEELARLKHVTGYSKLYRDHAYGKVVLTKSQIDERRAYHQAHPDEHIPEAL